MAFTTVIITGTFWGANGKPAQTGTVTATLSEALENGVTRVEPTGVVGIVNNGQLVANTANQPFQLVANDDPATLPAGSRYSFVVELDSAPVQEFDAIVPHLAAGGTIDLTALSP